MNLYMQIDCLAVSVLILISVLTCCVEGKGEVIWAVNSGGDYHEDSSGIKYQKDTLKIGTVSDYGKVMHIQRVPPDDMILYQTERYHISNFGYDVPISKDGDYVLVLKFSEVWFAQADQKVFNIMLNGYHTVVEELDIFARVGRGIAHDEIVPFTIRNGQLKVNGDSSKFDKKVSVEFVKIPGKDNPKINALYVMRGKVDDVPALLPWPTNERPEEEEDEEEMEDDIKKPRKRPSSGPKVQDPYAADDTGSMMLPVFVAIGAFIPLLFCLCKL